MVSPRRDPRRGVESQRGEKIALQRVAVPSLYADQMRTKAGADDCLFRWHGRAGDGSDGTFPSNDHFLHSHFAGIPEEASVLSFRSHGAEGGADFLSQGMESTNGGLGL